MIDNNIYISSAVLISQIYNDYNIQSDDFVSRLPIWVANALDELNLIQAYVEVEKNIEFDNNRCQVPWDFKGVIDVIINDIKAELRDSSKFNKDRIDEKIKTVPTFTPYFENENNEEINITKDNDNDYTLKVHNKEKAYYYISNNWIHTNISDGIIRLRYRALPVIFDNIINMDVPLVYNNGLLLRYLKLYCIKQMLLRGLKHPTLSLNNNNPYTNPAIELDRIRVATRVACNKFSNDRRQVISNILTKF